MLRRRRVGAVVCQIGLAVLFGSVAVRAQQKPLVLGQSLIEAQLTADLGDVGLAGKSAAIRVTIATGTMTADHRHTARTSILIMLQGAMTEVRGTVKHEYKAGDLFAVAEGVTHHAENHGSVPAVYIEINTTAKKP